MVDHPIECKCEMLLLDFDGVITDNSVFTLTDGTEAVKSSKYDSLALSVLREIYPLFPIVIITSEKSVVVDERAKKLNLRVERETKTRSKVTIAQELIAECGCSKDAVAFIGNDVNDLQLINYLDFTYCPCDAPERIKSAVKSVLSSRGGEGAIREWVELSFPEVL